MWINENVGIRCGFALLPWWVSCVCVSIKYIHMHIYMCVSVSVCVCIYIYIYIGFPGGSVVGIVLSHSVLFDSVTLWTKARHVPLSTGFSWSGLPFPSPQCLQSRKLRRPEFDSGRNNSLDRGAWQATVCRVAKNRTRLSEWAHCPYLYVCSYKFSGLFTTV